MVASSYRRGVSNPNLHAENNLCSLFVRGNGNNTCRNSNTRRETCGSNMHVLPFLGRWDFCFWHHSWRTPRTVPNLRETICALYLCEATGTTLAEIQKHDVRRVCGSNMHVSPFLGRWEFCFWHHSWRTNNKNFPKSAENNMCSLLARGNGNNASRNSKTRRETCGSNMFHRS